uniref:Uncharacterized protein n=1 Tax=Parascaris equorum TaxID=6256 RepID=A0A914RND8_PAREQ
MIISENSSPTEELYTSLTLYRYVMTFRERTKRCDNTHPDIIQGPVSAMNTMSELELEDDCRFRPTTENYTSDSRQRSDPFRRWDNEAYRFIIGNRDNKIYRYQIECPCGIDAKRTETTNDAFNNEYLFAKFGDIGFNSTGHVAASWVLLQAVGFFGDKLLRPAAERHFMKAATPKISGGIELYLLNCFSSLIEKKFVLIDRSYNVRIFLHGEGEGGMNLVMVCDSF